MKKNRKYEPGQEKPRESKGGSKSFSVLILR